MSEISSNVCVSCGAALRPGAKFCAGCGRPAAAANASPAPAGVASATNAEACPTCGMPRQPGAKFCRGCGGRLADANATNVAAAPASAAPAPSATVAAPTVAQPVVPPIVPAAAAVPIAPANSTAAAAPAPAPIASAAASAPAPPGAGPQAGVVPTAAVPQATPATIPVSRCAGCSAELTPGSKFCKTCGAPTVFVPSPVQSPAAPKPPLAQPFPAQPFPSQVVAASAPQAAKSGSGARIFLILILVLAVLGGCGYFGARYLAAHGELPAAIARYLPGAQSPSSAPGSPATQTPAPQGSAPGTAAPVTAAAPATRGAAPTAPLEAVNRQGYQPNASGYQQRPVVSGPAYPNYPAASPQGQNYPAPNPGPPNLPANNQGGPAPSYPNQGQGPQQNPNQGWQPQLSNRPAAPQGPSSASRPALPSAGIMTWTGHLQKNEQVVINGNYASTGQLQGYLPGVPVMVEITPTNVGVAVSPSPDNGWRKIVLRGSKNQDVVVRIQWKTIQ